MDKKLTRKEAKERSRQRLVAATIQLLHEEGPAGLTTGKVARAAGLSQPSFYVHFKGMAEALEAAAGEIGTQLRATLHEERQRIGPQRSRDTMHATFLATLNAFLAHPMFTEVILRYRRDAATPIGGYAKAVVDGIRQDLADDLRAMGLDETRLPTLSLFVDLTMGMTLQVLEGFLDERFTDRDESAEVLFRAAVSVYATLALLDQGAGPQR